MFFFLRSRSANSQLNRWVHRLIRLRNQLVVFHDCIREIPFDLDLKRRNPAWGLRTVDDVVALAAQFRLELRERVAMPANNLSLVFRRR